MSKTATEVFNHAAAKAKADRVTPFSHHWWLTKTLDEGEEMVGKCYAFSLGYILARRSGVDGADWIASMNAAAERGDEQVKKEIYGGGYMSEETLGDNLFDLQCSNRLLDRTIGLFHLGRYGEQTFDQTFHRYSSLAQYVTSDAPLYSLIHAPNHAMAVTATPFGDRESYTYFDPNFGEVVLGSQSRCKTFVTAIYSSSVFSRLYRRKTVSEVARGATLERQQKETRSLILRAQRFRETMN